MLGELDLGGDENRSISASEGPSSFHPEDFTQEIETHFDFQGVDLALAEKLVLALKAHIDRLKS